MKLNTNKRKKLLIVLAAVVALSVIAGIVAIIITVNANKQEAEDKNIVRGVSIASSPTKTVYYVGEAFDPTGTKIQVLTNSANYTYFVDWDQLTFEGFDSSVANEKLTITVSYKGYTTTFNVEVKDHEPETPTLTGLEVYNFETTYQLEEWNKYGPNSTGAYIRCIYSDGSVVEDIVLKDKYIFGVTKLSSAGATEITIKYSDGVTTVETTVEITVTN